MPRGRKFSISDKIHTLTLYSFFTAIIIIFQLIGLIPQISVTKLSFVLIPIVLGGCILGVKGGLWCGFIFGAIVFLSGVLGFDAFTASLFQLNPWFTIIICFSKAILAGGVSALIFHILKKKNFNLAIICASVAAPVVNTSVYCICMYVLFRSLVIGSFGMADDASFFVGFGFILSLVLSNFIVELIINVVITPVIANVIHRSKRISLM